MSNGPTPWLLRATAVALLAAATAAAFTGTEDDNFEDGTTMGWEEGAQSPNPPRNIADGGPGGAGDNYLQNESSGEFGAGGRLAMFNRAQWTGDYNAVGPAVVIVADMANFGDDPLSMRLAVLGSGGTWYASTDPEVLPADGAWYSVAFELSDSDMTLVAGGLSLSEVLDGVLELRILSSDSPGFMGDQIPATLGVDNFRVFSVPVELQSFSID